MTKPEFRICENKGADQLRSNLGFRYLYSKVLVHSRSEITYLLSYFVAIQPGLCRTWSEIPNEVFLTTRHRIRYQLRFVGSGSLLFLTPSEIQGPATLMSCMFDKNIHEGCP